MPDRFDPTYLVFSGLIRVAAMLGGEKTDIHYLLDRLDIRRDVVRSGLLERLNVPLFEANVYRAFGVLHAVSIDPELLVLSARRSLEAVESGKELDQKMRSFLDAALSLRDQYKRFCLAHRGNPEKAVQEFLGSNEVRRYVRRDWGRDNNGSGGAGNIM